MDERAQAPGLKYRKRKRGCDTPYWIADEAAIKAGYPVKCVNLARYRDNPDMLRSRCVRLQAEMLLWVNGQRNSLPAFDGTFGSLIELYTSDPESSYHKLKPSSRHPYGVYAGKLKGHIGERRIDACDGRDVRKWFKVWAGVEDLRSPNAKIPAARMGLTVLKSAVSFGVMCRLAGCAAFSAILREMEFPTNRRRPFAPTVSQVEAVIAAAHAAGAPGRALAYAIQFETTLRQWDVTGQWVPLAEQGPSAVIDGDRKWLGPTWSQVDEHLVLRLTHAKTAEMSGARSAYDLKLCPLVMRELAKMPPERRTGPLVIDERTGLPYRYDRFKDAWHADFKAAGIPAKVWNRDLRAGGVTEGGKAGASLEDRSKVAGHTDQRTTADVYDRDVLEAHRRVAKARTAWRNDGGT
jgi:integrase